MTSDPLAGCEPCPFCGNRDLAVNGHEAYTVVVCCSCLSEGPHGALSTAIKKWNTRTRATVDMLTLSRSDLEIELAHFKAEAARWLEVAGELARAEKALTERLDQIGGFGDGNCKVYIRGAHRDASPRVPRRNPRRPHPLQIEEGSVSPTRYRIIQDGKAVAECECVDPDAARREIMQYAKVYAQDGPVTVQAHNGRRWFRYTQEGNQ